MYFGPVGGYGIDHKHFTPLNSGSVFSMDDSMDSREDYDRFRFGDSASDGVHSRSSSVSTEPPRQSSSMADAAVTNRYRRTSATTAPPANPLQFIKVI